ncbi:putative membrane protein [Bordetella holmesii 30539]|uniref:Uncharacterized protein n=2 Tax=Bordetella holmesii TaxID=35814 RepID=A0A158M1E2_9BORD|nr:putative membrane protein [Bordetella holmesii ATCC 51541]AIT25941.1 putative membrane protein [Bordetella holmesii 44057]EWM42305.1 putative membrane protein [Bordetella holmesii 41130]EWM46511.1 putative membrane protein [Bordetella holmesii 35009]EWM50676.1 putative membrane protein [Bordetella holmesii 70147]EXF89550.1 putative membrane protein [Bordetella holmesii 30539]EXX95758.1 putative membrane protein [Bordetella holmesii 1058]KAK77461.1 hypothetical protein L503_2937 [Bordetell
MSLFSSSSLLRHGVLWRMAWAVAASLLIWSLLAWAMF